MMSATKSPTDHIPQTQEGYAAITNEGEEPESEHRVLSQGDTQPLIDSKSPRQVGYGTITRDDKEPNPEHRELSQSRSLPSPQNIQVVQGPKNYMGYAILSAIFCCFPFGIPAVYYAFKTSQHNKNMDWPKARQTALKTRQLVQMAVSLGMALWFLGAVIIIALSKPRK
ncbi:synapse differentiation-inducing gene protein 1-like [Haliotis asinina]|uniref:synapse differentiation-inducing gene protein 1-like n=1 Tax=Haliotis asinina TaxID=109174 RepID=UPI0035323871